MTTMHVDNAEKNTRQAPARRPAPGLSGAAASVQFVDNRAQSIAQRKLLDVAVHGPQLQRMRALGEMANGGAQLPIQREVKASTAPWGPTKGKWITTLDSAVGYLTEEEAQVAEDAILEAQANAREDAWQLAADQQAWQFADANGRLTAHFNDGWGAIYGITSNAGLRDYIDTAVPQDQEALGDQVIDLGNRLHAGEHVSRPCSIRYTVTGPIVVTVGTITRNVFAREVYHCGPSN